MSSSTADALGLSRAILCNGKKENIILQNNVHQVKFEIIYNIFLFIMILFQMTYLLGKLISSH